MAANTPIAREVAQGNSQASNTPGELIDIKAFELLDDVYNAVRHKSRMARLCETYRIRCDANVAFRDSSTFCVFVGQ